MRYKKPNNYMKCILKIFFILLIPNLIVAQSSFYTIDINFYSEKIEGRLSEIENKISDYDTLYFLISRSYPQESWNIILRNENLICVSEIRKGKYRIKRKRKKPIEFDISVHGSESFYNLLNFGDSLKPNIIRIASHGYHLAIGKYCIKTKSLTFSVLNGSLSSIKVLRNPSNSAQFQFRNNYLLFNEYFNNLPELGYAYDSDF